MVFLHIISECQIIVNSKLHVSHQSHVNQPYLKQEYHPRLGERYPAIYFEDLRDKNSHV